MNDKKIAFIICTNSELYCEECCWYIHQLNIPDGFILDIITITDAESMASGYNAAMKESDARYKIYLHHDLFITRKDFIKKLIEVFENPKIGMVGLLGTEKELPHADFASNWDIGGISVCNSLIAKEITHFQQSEKPYVKVNFIDGMLMATQYDIEWDEKHFDGWDFYDISQCKQFLEHNYEIVVLNDNYAFHDEGFCSTKDYDTYRKIFCKLNDGFYFVEAVPVTESYNETEIEKINKNLINAIDMHDYAKALKIKNGYHAEKAFNSTFSYLSIFLDILSQEMENPKEAILPNFESFQDFFDAYHLIKFLALRIEFGLSPKEAQKELVNFINNRIISIPMVVQVIFHSCIHPKDVLTKLRHL